MRTRKKKRIQEAYVEAPKLGLALWTEDEAGAYQTAPYAGQSWYEGSQPVCHPHEYVRNGTAKLLTLFEPASGQVRVKGVTSTANVVLHPWMQEQLLAILERLPPAPPVSDEAAKPPAVATLAAGAAQTLGAAGKDARLADALGAGQPGGPPLGGVGALVL